MDDQLPDQSILPLFSKQFPLVYQMYYWHRPPPNNSLVYECHITWNNRAGDYSREAIIQRGLLF